MEETKDNDNSKDDKFLAQHYRRGLRTERNRIVRLIEKDIEFQQNQLTHNFEKDKAILWRIRGMKFLIRKILGV